MSYILIKPNDNIQRIINFANIGDTLIFPAMKVDLNNYYLKPGLRYIGVGTITTPIEIRDTKDIEIVGFIFKSNWIERLIKRYKYSIKIYDSYNIKIISNTMHN